MPSHYNQQNDNPVVETFFATQTPKYYKPDGSEVAVGAPLHRHADGTIMTEHSMGPNDNSVVVTTQGNQKMPQARNNGDSVMTENALGQIEGKVYKKNQGGMLQGPSHEAGGIPAIVGGNTPIELEGGEYIINAQTVNAVGQEFLDELNSTQTTYHQGGFEQGELPPPSQFKNGGQVVRRNKRTRPVPTRRKGGKPIKRKGRKIKKMAHGGMHNSCPPGMTMGANGGCIPMSNGYKKGGVTKRRTVPRKMAHGGMHNSCPPGMTMQNGQCVSMGSNMGSGYRRGGIPKPRKKLQEGGLITRAKNTVASNVKNKQTPTIFKSANNLSKGQVGGNIVGVNTRMTSGGPSGVKAHKHTIITTPDGTSGHTSTERGHSHKVVNGVLSVECTPELDCHSHNF